MADGSKKPISKIKVGDEVIASDPLTGTRSKRKVTRVWVHQDTLASLVLEDEALTTTEDHPFWNAAHQAWERADQLNSGDVVLGADGRPVRAMRFQGSAGYRGIAYNLTVAGVHTYHVGDEAVLVHN